MDSALAKNSVSTYHYELEAKKAAAQKKISKTPIAGAPFATGFMGIGDSMAFDWLEKKKEGEVQLNDFTIKTPSKGTSGMVDETKFIGPSTKKQIELLEKIVTAVEKGGNVYLDSRKVGEVQSMNLVTLG